MRAIALWRVRTGCLDLRTDLVEALEFLAAAAAVTAAVVIP